jgi:allantoate deiminase
VPVGAVTGIVGQTRVAIAFTGEAGHAGTVPPHLRRDALPAAATRSLELEWRVAQEEASVRCHPELVARLSEAIARCGLPVVHLESGAGHDGVIMSRVVPVAMLFVRCQGGISHHPDESVRQDDVAVTLDVLDGFLASFNAELAA